MDLVLTKMPGKFQSTFVIETELSDFHLMTLTVIRKNSQRLNLEL